ncbi:hypothetical protein JL720_5386 [Aureococcus anophagefferens]|nr:hypothetical protein JL720_5386 [Aureococcus anophagefferens]
MDAGAMGALPTRDELFDVLLKGKQLEQTMKDRQAGGGAKSGRYKSTTRLDRCLRRVVYPRLKMGILPSATDSKMLFDMPGVYQCLRAAAELVVGRLFQSTAWSEHDERRRVADFEALDHDLRAAIGIAVRGAAQATADERARRRRASRGDARPAALV